MVCRTWVLGSCWLLLVGASGCDKGAGDTSSPVATGTAPRPQIQPDRSYLTPRFLAEAIDSLIQPLPQPVRLLSLTALHRQVIIQVQNAKELNKVDEYRYVKGNVTGPVPVKLMGKGKLRDNLFRLGTIDPHAAELVLTQVRAEYSEPIRKLTMIRNLPASMDIQFRVYLHTAAGDRIIAADKHGRLLGPLTPEPSSPHSPQLP